MIYTNRRPSKIWGAFAYFLPAIVYRIGARGVGIANMLSSTDHATTLPGEMWILAHRSLYFHS
jgi:hypothetical protein